MKHLLALFTILITVSIQVQAQGAFISPILPFPGTDNLPSEGDRSTLVRYRSSVKVYVTTTGLDPVSPYTLWAVVFNNPQYCQSSPCSSADLPVTPGHDARVEASIVFAGGGATDANGTGNFIGRVYETRFGVSNETLFGHGMASAKRAEIHVVVRGHGYPPETKLFAALSTFAGGCSSDNACEDQQFAVHRAAKGLYPSAIADQGGDHE